MFDKYKIVIYWVLKLILKCSKIKVFIVMYTNRNMKHYVN